MRSSPDSTANDNRHRPIPIPRGGFRTDEEEARWLEQTLVMRMREALASVGIKADPKPEGLYDLLLGSMQAAVERERAKKGA